MIGLLILAIIIYLFYKLSVWINKNGGGCLPDNDTISNTTINIVYNPTISVQGKVNFDNPHGFDLFRELFLDEKSAERYINGIEMEDLNGVLRVT
jgi:hypothetical protein